MNKETNNSITPDLIPSNPQYVTDTAPEEWWTLDILDCAGYEKFSEVIQYVKVLGRGRDERKFHVFTHLSTIADVLVMQWSGLDSSLIRNRYIPGNCFTLSAVVSWRRYQEIGLARELDTDYELVFSSHLRKFVNPTYFC
jgi:hypothetical protein